MSPQSTLQITFMGFVYSPILIIIINNVIVIFIILYNTFEYIAHNVCILWFAIVKDCVVLSWWMILVTHKHKHKHTPICAYCTSLTLVTKSDTTVNWISNGSDVLDACTKKRYKFIIYCMNGAPSPYVYIVIVGIGLMMRQCLPDKVLQNKYIVCCN